MAELEARFEKNESKNWRRTLPEGVEIKLGRAPGPEGWAADWDGFISSVHATLLWKDGKLRVRRRLEPRPTMNPIYYKAVENDDFTMGPNERFVIGGTTFSLLDGAARTNEQTPPKPELTEMTCSRQELRKVRFVDADQRMEALGRPPGDHPLFAQRRGIGTARRRCAAPRHSHGPGGRHRHLPRG